MRDRFEYASAWAVLKMLGVLPRRMARSHGAGVASLLFRLRPDIGKIADFNLRLAFPEWTESQRLRVTKGMVRNLGWMAAEFARLPHYTRENIPEAIVLDDFENFIEAERRGKGVLLLTGACRRLGTQSVRSRGLSQADAFPGTADRLSARGCAGQPLPRLQWQSTDYEE